jgi:hypothetical protein
VVRNSGQDQQRPAPIVARISTFSKRPCSSRCLMVCVSRERDPFGYDQGCSSAPTTRPHRFTIGFRDCLRVGSPTVATPAHRLPSRTSMGLSDRLGWQEGLRASSAGVSNDEATLAILLNHQAPALAPSRRVPSLEVALLLLTNDQNSSTSSAESLRSWTNTLR